VRASKKLQQGASFWEISLYVLMFLFISSVAIKLGPHYIQDASVGSALDGVHEAVAGKNTSELTTVDIKSRISKFFQVSMLPSEIEKQAEIVRTGGSVFIVLDYETRIPFMGNVDIVLSFHHEVDLTE
jgi:hypothetical protein